MLMQYALLSLLLYPDIGLPNLKPSLSDITGMLPKYKVTETHKRTLECPTGGNTHHVPKPHYPAIAKANKWEGKTMVMVEATQSGCVINARVHRSSGHEVLDQEAIKTVLQWSIHPRHLDVQSYQETKVFLMPVSFSLQEI